VNPITDYNTPTIADPSEARFAYADMSLAKLIGEALLGAYPQRSWQVHADSQNGIVDVILADVTSRWGYTIHLKSKSLFELQREAVFGGGEILERFNLSRARAFDRSSLDGLKRNILGEAIEA
jgi:hypothetical protein